MGPNHVEQEGRLQLAIQAMDNGTIKHLKAAARLYDVSRDTLRRRRAGTIARHEMSAPTRKLTDSEEEVLVNWILDMDSRGYSPRVAEVRRKANILLEERTQSTDIDPPTVGHNWATNFTKRRPELCSKYQRKKDHQRAKCEDPKIIGDWFKLVENVKSKYGVPDDDIYNFDETGFQMGVISSAKVVTASERRGSPVKIQPGNREWVTVIEAISGDGGLLDPLFIFAGRVHQTQWYQALQDDTYSNWHIAVSENGWTNNEIGIDWLRTVFDEPTKARCRGKYRLLIMDQHSSHNTVDFNNYCEKNNIITLFMPAHSSHILQPLDVGCFSPLKREYGKQVEELMRYGQHHIDKSEFISIYILARTRGLCNSNILAGFRAAGLIPFNPHAVLDILPLPISITTPSPPPSSQDPEQGWVPETPQNVDQLLSQTRTIRKSLKRRVILTPSPTNRAIIQVAKTAERALYEGRLLREEVAGLRTQIESDKKKRRIKRTYIRRAGLLRAGVVKISQVDREEEEDPDTIIVGGVARIRHCGRCNETGHNSRTCTSL